MATKPQRPCSKVGCRILTDERYCPEHKVERRKQYDRQRGTAAQRGYTSRWHKYSVAYRKEHPLCVGCLVANVISPSEHVDHIIAVSGPDDPLFWEQTNHQALCQSCHSKKTVLEDGGFGGRNKG